MANQLAGANRDKYDDLGPRFKLFLVNGSSRTPIETDLSQYIQKVEYESALDMADMLTLTVSNPGFIFSNDTQYAGPDFTSHKVFQPGNEVELHVGYGRNLRFLARAVLSKHVPVFPEDGVPTLTIKGYDKSQLMMNSMGSKASASKGGKVKTGITQATTGEQAQLRQAVDEDDQGEPHKESLASDIVAKIAKRYSFETDIDPTDRILKYGDGDGIVQKKGMTDYELIKILSNLSRREFWVDYSPEKQAWVLHFKKSAEGDQPGYRFVYGAGDKTTLLSFDCEYGLRDNITELVVLAWDEDRAEWISVARIQDVDGPDPRWRPGGGRQERTKETVSEDPTKKLAGKTKGDRVKQAGEAEAQIKRTLKSATSFRFSAAGAALDVITGRKFRDIQDASDFAYRWFKANKEGFLVGRGKLIGVEDLKARQVHVFEGLGKVLSGAYYIIAANHVLDADGGYRTEFTARKVINETRLEE